MITLWDKFKSAILWLDGDADAVVATVDAAGRNPVYTPQPTISAPNGPPSLATDGVALNDAVVSMVGVTLRPDPSAPASYIEITAFDAATTYTVTIAATAYDQLADTDAATTLAALATQIGAAASIVDDELIIATPETVTVSVAGGTGTITMEADATSVDFRIWLLSGGRWASANNGLFEGVSANWLERVISAGCERLYVEILATDGRVTPRVGPCGLEG